MKYLQQFLLLMMFVFAGELIHRFVPLPIPGGIWGLILLFAALVSGVVKLPQIEKLADFFLAVIVVLFVVPAVGIIDIWDEIAAYWLQILIVVVVTYFAAMASTGWTAEIMIRRMAKGAACKQACEKRRGGKKK
ncbi:MAG: CidA/LrgA family protein [Alphaproteobacteria bacterium]|nr:CidA/LrgA family protein [Alphaproteobacteria bacterium]